MGNDSYSRTLTAFSGAHIVAVFDNKVSLTLEAIGWTVRRETSGVWTLGDANSRAWIKGKRGIAGTLTFGIFDRDYLKEDILGPEVSTNNYDSSMEWWANRIQAIEETIGSRDTIMDITGKEQGVFLPGNAALYGYPSEGAIIKWFDNDTVARDAETFYRKRQILYNDELPEFDITLTMINEAGQAAQARILGVTITNETMGFGIDTMGTNKTCSFMAKGIVDLHPINPAS